MSLPSGWLETTIGECLSKTQTVDPRLYPDEKFDLYSVPSYSNYFPDCVAGIEIGSTKQEVREGDVLLCKIVPHIRRGWKIPARLENRQIASGEWIVFRDHGLDGEFLRRFVLSDQFHEQFMRTVSGVGGSLMRARPADAAKIIVPVPPLAEQRRIVAKLDALTARIARARAELDKVVNQAENLKRTVVQAAFGGMLSAKWRAEHPGRALTDAELESENLRVADSKRRKPAAAIDWKPDLHLPASWRWASIDQVVALFQYGTSSKTSDDAEGVPVLRMGNIQNGELNWTKLKYLPSQHGEFPELHLAMEDILFNRTNSFELVGKSAVFRGWPTPVSFASYLIRLRCSAILPDLLVRYLNSAIGRSWVESVASQQVGQANVNGTKLKSMGIPLPPPDEQNEINRVLNSTFARTSRLQAEASRACALLNRLEAAILAKAFRGELVPQDPNDEPADVLLDRIRAQRAAEPKQQRARRAIKPKQRRTKRTG